ncbi:hypothetical protein [Streptomyces iakyrus]|uniref:hypothetical protein n=1 Tax=Streptomyces iakyrus TaxID=68219 RepID=UPI003409107B
MTWMSNGMQHDFKAFWATLSPLLIGDYRIWPAWQTEHRSYLMTLAFEAVARANCGVEERLRAIWDNREVTFALYLRSFAHENLTSDSPRGEVKTFEMPGMETPQVLRDQLGSDATAVFIYNPSGSASATLAVPAIDRALGIAVDATWEAAVGRLIGRADIVVFAASVMTGGVETERALLRKARAQERTVVLLAEPPSEFTLAVHRSLQHAPLASPAPRATREQFPDFPYVIDGWNARDAGAIAALTEAMRGVRDSRRPALTGDPLELPTIEVDESLIVQAQHAITLGIREANRGQTKRAILHFTAAAYLSYEACSISTMLDAYAQLARWSTTLADPLASDYRLLHASFAVGTQHGFDAMASNFFEGR